MTAITADKLTTKKIKTQIKTLAQLGLVALAIVLSVKTAKAEVEVSELQFVLCDQSPAEVVAALGGAADDDERELYYLDTPNEDLFQLGSIVRVRQSSRGIVSAVKKNFEVGESIPFDQFGSGVYCEQDTYLPFAKVGCSVKEKHDDLAELSNAQREFLATVGVSDRLISASRVWGPAQEQEWDFEIDRLAFNLDVVSYAGDTMSMKLSVRVPLENTAAQQAVVQAKIEQAGLHLCADQAGKTEPVLAHLIHDGKLVSAISSKK